MIIKEVQILEKNNFLSSLLRELCTQNISYVLIDDENYLELHFNNYIYRFYEVHFENIEKDFVKSHLQLFEESSFENCVFTDEDALLKPEKTKKKGKSGNKRYTKKDMIRDRNNYKTSKANYKLR